MEGKAAPGVLVPNTRARFKSFRPPAKISDVDIDSSSTKIATGPLNGRRRGWMVKFKEPARVIIVPSFSPVSLTRKPLIANAMAPIPPGLPRRSMINPSASPLASIASPNFFKTLTRSKKMLSDT